MNTIADRVQDLIRLDVAPEMARTWANEEIKAGRKLTWPQFAKTQKADTEVTVPAQRTTKRTTPVNHFKVRQADQEAGNAHKLTNAELADKLATMSRIGTRAYNASIRAAITAEAATRLLNGTMVAR